MPDRCADCPFYQPFTPMDGFCHRTEANAFPGTKACNLSAGDAPETPLEKAEREILETEGIIAKARQRGHWKCVRDFTKKLNRQRKELECYARNAKAV